MLDTVRLDDTLGDTVATMDANFRVLFRELGRMQPQAMGEITTEKTSAKIKRIRRSFLLDHPTTAIKEQAGLILEEIEAALDNSIDAEDLKAQIRAVQRGFELDESPTEPITDFGAFRDALEALVYREVNEVQEP